jgi:hypothetical protein
MVKIMFEDLTYEAKVGLLSEAGVSSPKEMKWHILPVAVVEFERKNPALREGDFGGDVYSGDYDGYLY